MKYKHTIAILAYNSHDLTMQVLKELYKTSLNSKILFFDNGSEPSFEKLIHGYNIQYHRELENIFVNHFVLIFFEYKSLDAANLHVTKGSFFFLYL